FDLLRARDLALDRDGAGVADLFQLGDVAVDADLAFAEGLLFAQLAGTRRPGAILGVRAEDAAPEEAKRFDRLTGAVQQHVRRIEVDAQVVAADVLDEAEESGRGLLARFKREPLPVAGAVVAETLHHADDGAVLGLRVVLRHEAAMPGD